MALQSSASALQSSALGLQPWRPQSFPASSDGDATGGGAPFILPDSAFMVMDDLEVRNLAKQQLSSCVSPELLPYLERGTLVSLMRAKMRASTAIDPVPATPTDCRPRPTQDKPVPSARTGDKAPAPGTPTRAPQRSASPACQNRSIVGKATEQTSVQQPSLEPAVRNPQTKKPSRKSSKAKVKTGESASKSNLANKGPGKFLRTAIRKLEYGRHPGTASQDVATLEQDPTLSNSAAAVLDKEGRFDKAHYLKFAVAFKEAEKARDQALVRQGRWFDEPCLGMRAWNDHRGKGWIAHAPHNTRFTRWFTVSSWGSWRMAFLMARLQMKVWNETPQTVKTRPAPASASTLGNGPAANVAHALVDTPTPTSARKRMRGKGAPDSPGSSPTKSRSRSPSAPGVGKRRKIDASGSKAPRSLSTCSSPPCARGPLVGFIAQSQFARNILASIEQDGYVVLSGILEPSETEAAMRTMWDWVETVNPAIDRHQEATWYGKAFNVDPWPHLARDMMQQHQAGWVFGDLRETLATRVFEPLYGMKELHCSKDGFCFQRPTKTPLRRRAIDHYDQSGQRVGLHCIQGSVALLDQSLEDGCFECWPGSHRHHPNIATATKGQNRDWYKLTDGDKKVLKAAGCKPRRVPVRRGDVILWRSDLVHSGATPVGIRKSFRAVVYVCMLPAKLTPLEIYERKREAYEKLATGCHWPNKEEWFTKCRFRTDSFDAQPYFKSPPVLNDRLRELYGLSQYASLAA